MLFTSLSNLVWLDLRNNQITSLPAKIGLHRYFMGFSTKIFVDVLWILMDSCINWLMQMSENVAARRESYHRASTGTGWVELCHLVSVILYTRTSLHFINSIQWLWQYFGIGCMSLSGCLDLISITGGVGGTCYFFPSLFFSDPTPAVNCITFSDICVCTSQVTWLLSRPWVWGIAPSRFHLKRLWGRASNASYSTYGVPWPNDRLVCGTLFQVNDNDNCNVTWWSWTMWRQGVCVVSALLNTPTAICSIV